MAKSRILWLDDDLLFYSSFKNELEESYFIDVVKTPEIFWQTLDSHPGDYYCGILLDILLPFGGMDADKSNGGLRTGLAILEMLKGTKHQHIPVVIFTIRENNDVDDIGRKYGTRVVRKSEARISEFINTIKEAFGQ